MIRESTHVYVVTADSACKVGISRNPERRLKNLQTGCPDDLSIAWTAEVVGAVARKVERAIHHKLRKHREAGEWFSVSPDVAIAIAEAEAEPHRFTPKPTKNGRPRLLHMALITACSDRLDAIRLCVQESGMTQEDVGDALGIDKGQFSRILSGKAYFPDMKDDLLMEVCGNYAPLQFDAWATGFDLRPHAG